MTHRTVNWIKNDSVFNSTQSKKKKEEEMRLFDIIGCSFVLGRVEK